MPTTNPESTNPVYFLLSRKYNFKKILLISGFIFSNYNKKYKKNRDWLMASDELELLFKKIGELANKSLVRKIAVMSGP